jgi:hypothetical protein
LQFRMFPVQGHLLVTSGIISSTLRGSLTKRGTMYGMSESAQAGTFILLGL